MLKAKFYKTIVVNCSIPVVRKGLQIKYCISSMILMEFS